MIFNRKPLSVAVLAAATALSMTAARAQYKPPHEHANPYPANQSSTAASSMNAREQVADAMAVLKTMNADPGLRALLQEAHGVFIVPTYRQVALGIGGEGGEGVLLVHENGKWTGPGFYTLGGVTLGAQAGIANGHLAMILMNQVALNGFASRSKFALNADAGLSIVNYSARAHGASGRGDIVLWSETDGVFGDLAVGVTNIGYDAKETHAYYDRAVRPEQIASGAVTSDKAAELLQALPS
jgi:lipid-binding SYLF domain-containing protein